MQYPSREIFDQRFWRNLAIGCGIVTFYFVMLNLPLIGERLAWILGLLRPFVLGFAFAFLLNGLMKFVEKNWTQGIKNRKKRRFASVLVTFLITVGGVILLFAFLVPELLRSVGLLALRIPEYLQNLQEFWQGLMPGMVIPADQVTQMANNFVNQNLPKLFAYSSQLAGVMVHIAIGVIVAVYFLYNKETYMWQMRKLAEVFLSEPVRGETYKILRYGNETFTNFFYSKLLDSLIVGVICFLGLVVLGIPYALLISVIVGVTNVIPFFGPFIGAVPTTILVLAVDPVKAVWFVIFIIVLQQFDGNVLGPRIMGNSIGLPAIWVMFAILIGGGMFGFTGMILGIPVFAMVYKLIREAVNAKYMEKLHD